MVDAGAPFLAAPDSCLISMSICSYMHLVQSEVVCKSISKLMALSKYHIHGKLQNENFSLMNKDWKSIVAVGSPGSKVACDSHARFIKCNRLWLPVCRIFADPFR